MSLWSRIANLLRGDQLRREIDEELQSHLEEAIEQGRDPDEARKAFGSALRLREESRDFRLVPWLDSLRADAIFGWRQLMKNKVASAAAILSLALGIGACTSAFRLIDALLLRPLPVTGPEQLYALVWRTRLHGASAAPRNRHSNGNRRPSRRYRAPGDRGDLPHGACWRACGPRARVRLSAVYRGAALSGQSARPSDAGGSGTDDCNGSAPRRTAARDSGSPNRSGHDTTRRVGYREAGQASPVAIAPKSRIDPLAITTG